MGKPLPQYMIDIKKLSGMIGIQISGTEVRIGALTSVEDIRNNQILKRHFASLTQAAEQFAGVQIRHRATIGGNICNASPAGDLLPGLYAADAELTILSKGGYRRQSIREFIIGPGKTTLKPGELLYNIHLPITGRNSKFYKLGLRQSMAISVVNLAISWESSSAGAFHFSLTSGSVAPTVVYLKHFADAVNSSPRDLDTFLPLIDKDISPITDIRATSDYRRKVLKNIVRHELKTILEAPVV
ncbi:MAG: FAD binding domain-containing protein [Candidatus Marinimicrobia bacterium]|nr:FAD binding domain-containing protein [Candidatus Neomarinimicrobiota bacterium]